MQNDLSVMQKFLIFAADEYDADNNTSGSPYVQSVALGSTSAEGGGCGNAVSCGWCQRGQQGPHGSDGLNGVYHRIRHLQDARILACQLREPYTQSGGSEGYGIPDFKVAEPEGSRGVRTEKARRQTEGLEEPTGVESS